jgi:hypothetical protein
MGGQAIVVEKYIVEHDVVGYFENVEDAEGGEKRENHGSTPK